VHGGVPVREQCWVFRSRRNRTESVHCSPLEQGKRCTDQRYETNLNGLGVGRLLPAAYRCRCTLRYYTHQYHDISLLEECFALCYANNRNDKACRYNIRRPQWTYSQKSDQRADRHRSGCYTNQVESAEVSRRVQSDAHKGHAPGRRLLRRYKCYRRPELNAMAEESRNECDQAVVTLAGAQHGDWDDKNATGAKAPLNKSKPGAKPSDVDLCEGLWMYDFSTNTVCPNRLPDLRMTCTDHHDCRCSTFCEVCDLETDGEKTGSSTPYDQLLKMSVFQFFWLVRFMGGQYPKLQLHDDGQLPIILMCFTIRLMARPAFSFDARCCRMQIQPCHIRREFLDKGDENVVTYHRCRIVSKSCRVYVMQDYLTANDRISRLRASAFKPPRHRSADKQEDPTGDAGEEDAHTSEEECEAAVGEEQAAIDLQSTCDDVCFEPQSYSNAMFRWTRLQLLSKHIGVHTLIASCTDPQAIHRPKATKTHTSFCVSSAQTTGLLLLIVEDVRLLYWDLRYTYKHSLHIRQYDMVGHEMLVQNTFMGGSLDITSHSPLHGSSGHCRNIALDPVRSHLRRPHRK